MKQVVILGAGATGLTLAYKLTQNPDYFVTIIEKEGQIGGLASSFTYKDAKLDFGPHKIYTQFPEVEAELKKILGEDLLAKPKKSKIRLMGNYFDYPVKINELLFKMNPVTAASCGLSYGLNTVKNKILYNEPATTEAYLKQRFGKTTYEIVFKDFATKVWGDPSKLSYELAKARVSIPSLPEMFKRVLLGDKGQKEINAKVFYYPKYGAIELYEKMLEKINATGRCKLIMKCKPTAIETNSKDKLTSIKIKHANGKEETIPAEYFVSTIPLEMLPPLWQPAMPVNVVNAFNGLKYRSLVLLYLVVDRDRLFPDSFIFFPEKDFRFHRLSEQKAFSEYTVPEGKTILCVEMTCDRDSDFYNLNNKELFERVIGDVEKTGFLKREEVKEYFTFRMHGIYPVYDLEFRKNLTTILDYIDKFNNFMTLGRRGLFNYNNQDHCMDMAFKAAAHIISNSSMAQWKEVRKKFDEYVIID